MKIARLALFTFLIAAATYPALAVDSVAWDSSGNNLLSGTYNFREVVWRNKDDLNRVAIYGTIQFDGNGGFSLSSSVMDAKIGSVQSFSTTGAYRISASGMGYLDDPFRLSPTRPNYTIWGLVSKGIFIGSSTDDSVSNLFIAAQAPSAAQTNASFSGSYQAAAVNFPSGNVAQARDMLFPLNPNGQGSLGNVDLSGFVGAGGTTVTQRVTGASYSFANGAMTLAFGGSLLTQTLIAGNALCYLSADGNFFFGGAPDGWDMIVGMRAFSGTVLSDALKGIYYQAGADVKPSTGFSTLATYYGAFSASSGTIIGHQRVLVADPSLSYIPYDYTYSDSFTLGSDGSHDDFLGLHNIIGAGGAIRIGFGNQDRLGINVSLRAPDFSGSGVFLNPAGISNAGSSAPFTVGVSRGGFIALYGTNLAPTTLQNDSMPFTLGGVQVLINGRQAPLYVVSSGFVSAIVPYATTGTVASIQVINNGTASATRTVRIKDGTPGIYTRPPGGVGYAIAQHVQDGSFAEVTPQNPAKRGETILMYLTGLGDVDPPVPDGKPAPANPLSYAKIHPIVLVDNEQVVPTFAGLTPTIVALYAITFTIPLDIAPGDVYVDISLPDSYTTEAQISIANSNIANDPAAASSPQRARHRDRPVVPRPGNPQR